MNKIIFALFALPIIISVFRHQKLMDEKKVAVKYEQRNKQFDSVKISLERRAEQAGVKWIIMPGDKSISSITYRRVAAGEEFNIYLPKEEIHYKADCRGWKEFISSGLMDWKGRNPDLYCRNLSIFYCTVCMDSLQHRN
jgi:hypothetical protein